MRALLRSAVLCGEFLLGRLAILSVASVVFEKVAEPAVVPWA